jgi:hypothetical protein
LQPKQQRPVDHHEDIVGANDEPFKDQSAGVNNKSTGGNGVNNKSTGGNGVNNQSTGGNNDDEVKQRYS